MKVTPKELWVIAPKLQVALKEVLTSKRSVRDESNQDLETDNNLLNLGSGDSCEVLATQ